VGGVHDTKFGTGKAKYIQVGRGKKKAKKKGIRKQIRTEIRKGAESSVEGVCQEREGGLEKNTRALPCLPIC